MRAILALILPASLLLAGCFGGGQPAADDGATPAPEATVSDVPPGCDPARPAIVHGFDGAVVQDYEGPVGIPCLVPSPWSGYEPTIGITADGSVFLYPAWPREPFDDGILSRALGMGIARTADEGGNWTRQLSTIGPVNWHPFTADPFMYVDPGTDRIFMEDLIIPPFNCSNLSFSDDGGETWTQTLGGCLVWDHVSIFAGPPVSSSPDGYPNMVYRCAINLVATTVFSIATGCQSSLDGGMTWGAPTNPYFMGPDGPYVPPDCNGGAHHGLVDHRGWVWLPRGWCNDPYVAISKDEGATWEQHRIHDERVDSGHEVGVAVDTSGTAYAFWFGNGDRPLLSISKDGGQTWSEPRDVGPPGVIRGAMPSIEAASTGRIAFTYVANIEEDDGQGIHAVVTVATGADTDDPVFQTGFANAPEEPLATGGCSGQACSGQGDFLTMRIGPNGVPWGAFMNQDALAAGRLWGAPGLWDPADPDWRYP